MRQYPSTHCVADTSSSPRVLALFNGAVQQLISNALTLQLPLPDLYTSTWALSTSSF